MKFSGFILILMFVGFGCNDRGMAQDIQPNNQIRFISRNLGGPRLGFTLIPGKGELADELEDNNIGHLLSQFGWHFEYQIVPNVEGPVFLIEFVPLVAAVEYGKFLPSATLGFGIRFPNGIEFGMGPNILAANSGVTSALMLTVGKSFDFGGVSIPLNLAFTTNPKGSRISFVFGYAIEK